MTPIQRWHDYTKSRNPAGLDALLAEDCVFHSPVVHSPQVGAPITKMYLTAAMHVLGGENFRYEREIIGECDAMLEFKTEIDGIQINGVDIIRWNEAGLITDFKVMVRPLKAINMLHEMMRDMLEKISPAQ